MNTKFNFSYVLSDLEQKAFEEWKKNIVDNYGDEGLLIYHLSTTGEDSSFAITSDHSGETICFENDNTTIIGK